MQKKKKENDCWVLKKSERILTNEPYKEEKRVFLVRDKIAKIMTVGLKKKREK